MGKSNRWALYTNSSRHALSFSPFQQAMASSYTDFDLSGTTKSGSMPMIFPKPLHMGHAPMGLLKSNKCSVGSTKRIPSISKRSQNHSYSPSW